MVDHVFRLHGIPADIISDRGPQFISQVCKAMGATASLSSGYHLQTAAAGKSEDGGGPPVHYLHQTVNPLNSPGWSMYTHILKEIAVPSAEDLEAHPHSTSSLIHLVPDRG